MRREERVTVQGPVKKQQQDGMSHRGVTPPPPGTSLPPPGTSLPPPPLLPFQCWRLTAKTLLRCQEDLSLTIFGGAIGGPKQEGGPSLTPPPPSDPPPPLLPPF